ncbi:hypothetical protein B0H17DRAFT_1079159 [Mycena rosella]|uniref:F-box domain-containing protein n=1 Tax=Mycena rosella TaxID=1033263 RepID=A0AAD7D540_MYCRO|nr:hypothetical protein B0H17DRAFT_1079159 [Mycena rosella]
MSFAARVPAELLGEIVTYFSRDSDHETLQQLALTTRYFHLLSRPVLFRSFKFHPYSMGYDMPGLSNLLPILLASELDRARQRLEFWASEMIAPHVLVCDVAPLTFEEIGPRLSAEEDPYILLAAFFQCLPRFTKLQCFVGIHVHFTRAAMANLCVLPNLRSVTIAEGTGTVSAGELGLEVAPQSLKLDVFQFYNNEESQETWWFRALCPDTLHLLKLEMSTRFYQIFFSGIHSSIPCFPNVHTLSIELGRLAAPLHLIPLSKFPAVQCLDLTGVYIRGYLPAFPELDGPGYCPLLVDYTGPYHILPLLHFSNLRCLTIDICNLGNFLETICSISKPNNIELLDITLNNSVPSLGSLRDLLPDLKELLLTIVHYPYLSVAHLLLDDLPSSLPPNIIKLAIKWQFAEVLVPSLPELKDDIVSQRPTLKTLWIHCPGFVYVWAKMPDGEHSTIIGGTKAAERLLLEFERLFYGYWRTQDFDSNTDSDSDSDSGLDE